MVEGRQGATHLPGVFQSLVAGVIVAACTSGVGYFWKHLLGEEAPGWAQATLPSAIGAGAVFTALVFTSRLLVDRVSRRRHATAKAKGDRLSIYVAQFDGDDEQGALQRSVIDTIRRELGRDAVEVVPAGILLRLRQAGLSDDDAILAAARQGQTLLRRKRGDLLIWGHAARDGSRTQIDLRFVSAEIMAENTRVGLTDKLLLEPEFLSDMGTVLATMALIATAPAMQGAGRYVVDRLIPAAKRLERLIQTPPPGFRGVDRAQISFSYGLVQTVIGEQSSEPTALEAAVAALHVALEEFPRGKAPFQWAMAQNNLGAALQALGARKRDAALLKAAVAAFRAALEELTRERVPLDWAMTQNNLGNALRVLAEREGGTARLEQAITAHCAALEENTRKRAPLQWAKTQNNLGNALARLGEHGNGTARLEESVSAYREAIKEWTRRRVPLYWAATQNNMGNALAKLGDLTADTRWLKDAVAAYRGALKEWTRDRVPLDWAMTQNNLGAALQILGAQEVGTARLKAAVTAYRAALEERTQDRMPLDWAGTQNNLGNALASLGKREGSTARLKEAVAAFHEALTELTFDLVPQLWAGTQYNLGLALQILAELEGGAARLREAVAAWEASLTVTVATWPPERVNWMRDWIAQAKAEIARRVAS
jgi:tetratricopeptide (TPR) repeat protein